MEQVCCFIEIVKLRNSVSKILSDDFQRDQLCHVPHKAFHLIGQAEIALVLLFVSSGHTVSLCHNLAQLRREFCKGVAYLVKLRCKGSERGGDAITSSLELIERVCIQLIIDRWDFSNGVHCTANRFQSRSIQTGKRGQPTL